jgi:hypothetical protein
MWCAVSLLEYPAAKCADGAPGRAQRRNSGTEAHTTFDNTVRLHT